jgi:acetoin utilization deacetylase AcuC-like enzyme
MRSDQIVTFFRDEQALGDRESRNQSRSPEKARLIMEKISDLGLSTAFPVDASFPPMDRRDLLRAHTPHYVDSFLHGHQPLCETNSLKWSQELVRAVLYSNSSLYHAINHVILNPQVITLSPTSGFHHAGPEEGSGFCTFSGQVIAALKVYEDHKLSGVFIDLDGHFGNSIEDTRAFSPDLNRAIPKGCNINPQGRHEEYIAHFRAQLADLQERVLNHEIGYVVFCHGADSHQDDDRGGQCTTEEWLTCSRMFYRWLKTVDSLRGEPLPCCLSLFGGYREDDYDSVINLHIADLVECLNIVGERTISFEPSVKKKSQH